MSFGSCYLKKEDDFSIMESCRVQINGSQIGLLLNLEVSQFFKNTTDNLAQVSYIFPNDLKICIYETTFVIGEQIIKPKLIGRKEAKLAFKEAVESGKTAIYGSNIPCGLTEFELGNLPINSECRVILKMAFKANFVDSNTFFFKIPLDVYTPNGSVNCINIKSNFSLSIQADKENICSIKSNVKNGKYNEKENIFSISNEIQNKIHENSIILHFKTKEEICSSMILPHKSNYCAAFVVNNLPQFLQKCESEFIFLVDCSGSMNGISIINAGKCLELFIRSLPENSFFNIICFGSKFDKLFPSTTRYNKKTAAKAIELAQTIKANRGGTNIYDPLFEVFNEKAMALNRNIFILTDGEVSNPEKIIELVTLNSNNNRCYTIGLGRGCDAGLIEGIAEASGGKCNFVQSGDSISEKVIPQLRYSLGDYIEKIEVHCEGENNDSFEVAPYPITPICYGKGSYIFIHSKKNEDQNPFKNSLLITGEANNDIIEIPIYEVIELDDYEEDIFGCSRGMNIGKAIAPLFSYEMLKHFEHQNYLSPKEEEMAINLSISSGVLCKYTGYVGMMESSEEIGEKNRDIVSANNLQKNTCIVIDGKPYNIVDLSRAKTGKHGHGRVSIVVCDLETGKSFQKVFSSSNSVEVSYNNSHSDSNICRDFDIFPLMNYQNIEGYWENHSIICNIANIEIDHIDKLKLDDKILEDRCIATLVSIAILHVLAFDKRNSWNIIEEKGMAWLNKNITNASINEILIEIEGMIQNQ